MKYSDAEYDLLNQRPELHWFCTACREPAIHAIQSDKEIEEGCSYYMKKFTSRVTALEEQTAKKADKTEVEAIKEKVTKMEKNEQPQVDAIAKMKEKLT